MRRRAAEHEQAQGSSTSRATRGGDALALRPPSYGVAFADRPTQVAGRSGAHLPAALREKMEAAFGVDFTPVRVHEDPHARALGALAYTRGVNIHFAPGQYRPDTQRGQELVGHELAHVVQQSQGRVRSAGTALVIDSDAALEREAHELGARAARAPHTAARALRTLTPPAHAPVQRFEAPVHEAAERQGLTMERGGTRAAAGLTNEEASAVYFGNWMRDVNQALVPILTQLMPPDVVFSALALMAAKKFGRALTPEQLGYYIPAEHIDSPAGLTNEDDLLPGQPAITAPQVPGATPRPDAYVTEQEPVSPTARAIPGAPEGSLFAVDQTGTAAWIRRTSLHVERRLELAARRGRNPEGMMHFGAALHAVEDLFAHSNWIEIALDSMLQDPRHRRTFLPQLRGDARRVFTYSARQAVPGRRGTRPVLMTGSFTGADTQISLTSELTKFLSTPLPPPASFEEALVEERFMAALLRAYQTQLQQNPQFANGVRGILRSRGVPEFAINIIMALPVADIYARTRVHLPREVHERIDPALNDVRTFIRDQVSRRVLQPIARRLEAEALNARVADTSLIVFLRQQEQRRTQTVAELGDAERGMMQTVEEFTGRTLEEQNARAQASATRHAAALQQTPERIVAGPSHSQISKDHPNSPFFGIAFRVATEAVRRLREKMVAAWNEQAGGSAAAFDFSWDNFPSIRGVPEAQRELAEQNRGLYHATRTERREHEQESLDRGNRIVAGGGDVHVEEGQPAPRFQPYNIAAMRRDSADRIRGAAAALRAAASAPGSAANALQRLQELIGLLDAQSERTRRAQETLDRAAASLRRSGQTANRAGGMTEIADQLDRDATAVEAATTLEQRWRVNDALVASRDAALAALAESPALRSGLAASILVVLDDVITETTPAYRLEQRDVIGGAELRGHTGRAGPLRTVRIELGDPERASDPRWHGGRRPPALVALVREARRLLNHPYEDRWWEPIVRDYVTRNAAQIVADIEARNAGYSTLRRPGEHR